MLLPSISKNALTLLLFALVSTGLSALTYWLTKDKIQSEKELALKRLIVQLVDENAFDNDVYNDCIKIADDEWIATVAPAKIYRMRLADKPAAVIIELTTPEGYSGNITLAVGLLADDTVSGVSIIDHKETPGLGDKIEAKKSDWLTQFEGQSLSKTDADKWLVKKDNGPFDALTGATVTPRAVVKAIKNSLLYWQKNKSSVFSKTANCREQPQ